MSRALATILAAIAVAVPSLALDEPRGGSRSVIRAKCDALFMEVTEAQAKYIKDRHGAKDDEARKLSPPDLKKYATRFVAMAREHPDDPAAVDALIHSIALDPFVLMDADHRTVAPRHPERQLPTCGGVR